MKDQSTRSKVVTRRTYNRPLDKDGKEFESWPMTCTRVINHQQWLWERALGRSLNRVEEAELRSLKKLMLARECLTSGRTLWLGGTEVSKRREASQFNCSGEICETVHDVVDAFWLLLQGCGVGGKADNGTLNGFAKEIKEVRTIRSARTIEQWEAGERGEERNSERFYTDADGSKVYALTIGDSAEAWAKSPGKLLALKEPVDVIELIYSEIRAPGIRLTGYGWISSGDETLSVALEAICWILSRRAGQLLSKEDINDIINWLGTTLSSRRSAEILLMDVDDKEAQDFALRKKNYWESNVQREQSNNSLVFWSRPSRIELRGIFDLIEEGGGSEPGFINGEAALKRAPWFKTLNPCAEILLGNKSFCNLVETNLGAFNGRFADLLEAHRLIARANYRQTCVNLDDGLLQRTWHELNEFLRLCGAGVTGIVMWEKEGDDSAWKQLREAAVNGANSMADELGLPRAKLVTTVKPSGTLSKVMDCTEGAHKPLGRYIFNWITFSNYDPLIAEFKKANYRIIDKPHSPDSKLVCLPVAYDDVEFDVVERSVEPPRSFKTYVAERLGLQKPPPVVEKLYVNLESAVSQLERYKRLMTHYVDHNCSITVSYDSNEVPDIIDWLYDNWDSYVGVSFIYRNDPTKTAADLGYKYLPQEVVTKRVYDEYVSTLGEIDLDGANSLEELDEDECAGGACPVR